eukprot:scaffold1585_cov96-Isochrysis_galbana.AAC.2
MIWSRGVSSASSAYSSGRGRGKLSRRGPLFIPPVPHLVGGDGSTLSGASSRASPSVSSPRVFCVALCWLVASSRPPHDATTQEDTARTLQKNLFLQQNGLLAFQSQFQRGRRHRPVIAEMLPSGYQKLTDPSTGRPYYVNLVTGQTSWSPPAGAEAAPAPAAGGAGGAAPAACGSLGHGPRPKPSLALRAR